MGTILRVTDLKKEYGPNLIFDHVNFALNAGQKAALVGVNGAGKTTLFKCLLGMEEKDGGSISLEPGISLGYMEQIPDFAPGTTLLAGVLTGFQDLFLQKERLTRMEEQMAVLQGDALDLSLIHICLRPYRRLKQQQETHRL